MKVETLYIIQVALPDGQDESRFGDSEGASGAEALMQRCLQKSRAKTIHLIRYAPYTYNFINKVVNPSNPVNDEGKSLQRKTQETTKSDGVGVGVYVIGHGNVEGLRGIKADSLPGMFERLGVPPIRKLCLVSCNVAREGTQSFTLPNSNTAKNYLAACCAWLGANGHPDIKVAGWDCFVTVAFPRAGSSLVGEKMKKAMKDGSKTREGLVGAKVSSMNGKKVRVDDDVRAAHKKYYCWTQQDGLTTLAANEWSDA